MVIVESKATNHINDSWNNSQLPKDYHYFPRSRITRHGFPAANTPSGMSLVTTLPAPTTERAPTLTPGQMIAPPPTHTSSPTSTAMPDSRPILRLAALSG